MTTLPPELVLACLSHLNPRDRSTVPTLLSVSLASRSFNELSQSSSLWRPLLKIHYSRPGKPSPAPDSPQSPYETFKRRTLADSHAKSLVRRLQQPLGRLPIMEELRTTLGSDVIQVLDDGDWCQAEREPENYLSLMYWSEEARKAILRDEAIRVWNEIADRHEAGEEREDDFERGVNAFGAFRGFDPQTLEERYFNLDQHAQLLSLTASTPEKPVDRLNWIANQVCDYMLSIGIKPAAAGMFHDLSNHYVELAFVNSNNPDENHGTLPMTLVSIFCSFVRRLPNCQDIEVRPIGFPGTVLAGLRIRGSNDDWVYVNPFSSPRGRLPTRASLRAMLVSMGTDEEPAFFRAASAREMCSRVGRNILTSIQTRQLSSQNVGIACLYSTAHAFFAFNYRRSTAQDDLAPAFPNYTEWLTSIIQAEYPYDVPFLVDQVLPALRRNAGIAVGNAQRASRVEGLVEAIKEEDQKAVEKKWVNGRIKWSIGHIFRHRLFGYHAVIRGWDYTCEASETWIMQMQVDRLPFGRDQPFYHVIVADGSSRYVAQENVTYEPVSPSVVSRLMQDSTIGRYFRRVEGGILSGAGLEGEGEDFEEERLRFVKSIETEAEYPDS
ncbi:hypothetical protein JCM3765_004896 [Sporobolomyces pararoseus]